MAEEPANDVDELTVGELRDRANELEITGSNSMEEDELRQAVADAELQLDEEDDEEVGEAFETESAEPSDDAEDPDDAPAPEGGQADDGEKPASEITAPSIGPKTEIHKDPPEERLSKHEQSTVDAMGLDKRRGVVGEKYGASVAKQVTVYGVFLVVLAALLIGGKLAIDELDKGPAENQDRAPWSQAGAEQRPPGDLDFPPSVTP
jgi:hypothetical protein